MLNELKFCRYSNCNTLISDNDKFVYYDNEYFCSPECFYNEVVDFDFPDKISNVEELIETYDVRVEEIKELKEEHTQTIEELKKEHKEELEKKEEFYEDKFIELNNLKDCEIDLLKREIESLSKPRRVRVK